MRIVFAIGTSCHSGVRVSTSTLPTRHARPPSRALRPAPLARFLFLHADQSNQFET